MPKTLRETKKAVVAPPQPPQAPPEFVLGALLFTREQMSHFFNLLNEMTTKTLAGDFSPEDVDKGNELLDDIRNRWNFATTTVSQ